jgi:pyruvate formate lyase activating enzyme
MLQSLVCDIQRFSVHDGPGIRTTVFFKGCPLRCKWCQNPEALKFENELVFSPERCIACGDCSEACPHQAISFENGPLINWALCQACFTCTEVCPSRALEPAAREYSASKLAVELLKDREFYEPEGGVTLSGGEPFSRPSFLLELLPLLKKEKIHIAAQTCGHFEWKTIDPFLDMIDLVIYDLKAISPELHQSLTGKNNRLILENLHRLVERNISHQIRIPIVPGLNDSADELKAIARFVLDLKETEIWLIPYHRLGEGKLKKLNTALKPLGINTPGEKELRRWAEVFANFDLQVRSHALLLKD